VPAVLIGALGLALIGFTSLLIPSLVPTLESAFVQTDADVGIAVFLIASGWGVGSFVGGALTERVGRRRVLVFAAVLIAAGLGAQAVAGIWPLFVAAAVIAEVGSGAIDGGMNSVVLDAYGARSSGRLNAAHLGVGVGALVAPLVVGQALARGIDWRPLFAGSAVLALAFAVLLAAAPLPRTHRDDARSARATRREIFASLAFVALALAIATYVAAEVGVSTWLVRYLSSAPVEVATAALGIYWGGLAVGRLVAALTADRVPIAAFAIAAVLAASVVLVGALGVSDVTLSVVLFGLVGVAYGPVYPLVMSIAGGRFPGRSALVAGSLASAATVGGIIYPPVIGLLSASIGLRGGMLGAAGIGLLCAGAILVAHRDPSR